MVESETGNKKHIRKHKLLPKYLEKTKIDEMLEKALVDKFLQGELSRDDLNLYLNIIGIS